MENQSMDLAQAFCEDCRRRRHVAGEIVRGGAPFDREQLDRLHQEFDTLYGGARAVHLPELERFFSGMARYARYLRNRQMSLKEIDQQAWQALQDGITEWQHCDGNEPDCLINGDSFKTALLKEIENRIDNGEAK